jgi:hypothetical protein
MRFLSKVIFLGVLRCLDPVQNWVITRILQFPFASSGIIATISEGLLTTNSDSSTLTRVSGSLSSSKYSPFDGSGPSIFSLCPRVEVEKLGIYGSAFGNIFLDRVFNTFPNAMDYRP